MKIFSYDSKFSQLVLKLAQSCYLNLLWMACSIPVFTAGAATTALYSVTLKLVKTRRAPWPPPSSALSGRTSSRRRSSG